MGSLANLDLERYSKIFQNVYQMMNSRHYVPCFDTPKQFSHEQWVQRYMDLIVRGHSNPIEFMEQLTLFFEKDSPRDSPRDITMVYFSVLSSKFCKDDIKYVYDRMIQLGATSVILVVNGAVTFDVKRAMQTMGPNNQIFTEDSLTRNVTEHHLVPKYTLLAKTQAEQILNEYSVSTSQLPSMEVTDPIARYYNYKIGDIVKIERLDGTIFYRVVVPE